VARARSGEGPTLLELETYRMGAHSSSDDPTRYRDQNEVELWKKRDPLDRLRNKLMAEGHWSTAKEDALRAELLAEVNSAIETSEKLPNPADETLFEDVYAELPWHLKEQRQEFFEYLSRE
jgi:pyruvate dehydrogenase E1 component alpha subunit/2-oxoisovalerate dehydrogenase E1 component alpha subunit